MPTFPKMEVRLANTAESTAHISQEPPAGPLGAPGRYAMTTAPTVTHTSPASFHSVTGSPKSKKASTTVRPVLHLSTGATRLTSPLASARK